MQQNVQPKTANRRWMKSVVAASAAGLPQLPWQRKAVKPLAQLQPSQALRAKAAR